ncbi:efflux RND transporter periplasmic adaptor subunit [Nodosilinea sp. LEGE 06152]|uniref:efflux RND transporter periplasmic adaptor subunit n=1 Tax=Nodosilinea sp. LEGE 06152 TaxID=2777966 RepID=UPI00187E2FED|nr:efflux RND transporter periplasmic adaptor subunit [Nodosilinea sp. LEGE 06152]MBE9157539.1 efflux RND transporter periplasmic adaptor subunit [Nodosilinea sp. LEGE 06152]
MSDCSLPENTQSQETLSVVHTSAPARPNRYLNRRWLLGLGATGLLLAVGIPLLQSRLVAQDSQSEASSVNVLAVETLTVDTVSSYEVARAYTGEIAALRSSDLGFTRSGELVQVLVAEGDRVSSGQALAQLDTQSLLTQRRQLEAQLAQAQAQLLELQRGARQEAIAAAQAQVRDVDNQLALQRQQRERREFLYERGAISKEQLDEFSFGADALAARRDSAQSSLDELLNGTRPEQVAAQQAVVQQLEASIASIDVDLNQSTLRAPFDGIVAVRQVDEGVVVAAGQTVVRLVESVAPEARIGMPTRAASRLRTGEAVTVNADTESFPATIKAVLPEVNGTTRTQVVVLQLEPAALTRVSPGQTVRVELNETVPTSGLWLPIEALTQDIRGLWSAYAVVPMETEFGDTAYQVQPKAVEILHQESDRVLVQGTLQGGDRIVASGIHRLVPGQQVRPLGD